MQETLEVYYVDQEKLYNYHSIINLKANNKKIEFKKLVEQSTWVESMAA